MGPIRLCVSQIKTSVHYLPLVCLLFTVCCIQWPCQGHFYLSVVSWLPQSPRSSSSAPCPWLFLRLEDLGDSKERKDQQEKLRQRKGIRFKHDCEICIHKGRIIHWSNSCLFVGELAALSSLLETPLLPVGFSGKYPTKTGKLVVPGIAGNGTQRMV